MTHTAKVALTQGALFNSMAMKCFESASAAMVGTGKRAMNINVTRCKANEKDIMAACINDAARAHFRNEIALGDTLQLGNIVEMYLRMTPEERDSFERMTEAIKAGELVEVKGREEAA